MEGVGAPEDANRCCHGFVGWETAAGVGARSENGS